MFFTLLPLIQLYKHLLWRSKLGTKRVCPYSGATLMMVAVHVPRQNLLLSFGPPCEQVRAATRREWRWLVIWRFGMMKANSVKTDMAVSSII